ncbi:uncharacterized protein UMAG_03251 [Mycosarcoma maydis]|uniref:Transcription factor TFIIIC triple barrel domain-containing protein n=1 Tax=Mycosarcoma maydis TaxID=5270 RepID=A0A0D1DWU1_MYCMD|nr:uncharacterized protein UMAG_03251 [Ustilago maydis 521]KIS68679.1 hypothetical protein UMAG_03251 [Ustilago maydis 521]|eukprot:XP_011389671.1 hypothetical protein UMAG_03251 [Ustilago maydis 521]
MSCTPIVDASWHRLADDTFDTRPSCSTPLDPASSAADAGATDSDVSSSWSFSDQEELVTLDLGVERIAKRALLGYTVGLDYVDPAPSASAASAASSSARTVRSSRNTARNTSQTSATEACSGAVAHIAAGKQLSITGLDSATPLMKINDTVLRGTQMQMYGSEIILKDEFDPTRDRSRQHRLQPIASSDGRADARSSTTRKRIMFTPLYDPTSQQTVSDANDAYHELRALARNAHHVNLSDPSHCDHPSSQIATGNPTSAQSESARARNKRKDISEEEQIIRAAERKIRKAAKAHFKNQQHASSSAHTAHPDDLHHTTVQPDPNPNHNPNHNNDQHVNTTPRSPHPPPPFDQQ